MFKETKRTYLRPFCRGGTHGVFLYDWLHEERAVMYTHYYKCMSLEDVDLAFTLYCKTFMIMNQDRVPVGFISYTERGGIYEASIFIGEDHENQKHARDAGWILGDYLFNKLNAHKVVYIITEHNKRMIDVIKSYGAKQEAILPSEYYLNGKWHDRIYLAMYEKDFDKFFKLKEEEANV
jgi:RimJ/RimL family protein N-acetyltransferase